VSVGLLRGTGNPAIWGKALERKKEVGRIRLPQILPPL